MNVKCFVHPLVFCIAIVAINNNCAYAGGLLHKLVTSPAAHKPKVKRERNAPAKVQKSVAKLHPPTHMQKCNVKCGKCAAGHPCCRKHLLHHLAPHHPPYAPVVQSQAFRVQPPASNAMQLRMEFRKADSPPQQQRQRDHVPPPQEQRYYEEPIQKQCPVQHYGMPAQSPGEFSAQRRLVQLEDRVDLLIDKMDTLLQHESRFARRGADRYGE